MTSMDLRGIHDILLENHPGPVDPENRRYRQWLEDGLKLAEARAQAATSFADYVRSLEFYTNGFQDDHIGIGLEVEPSSIYWPGFVVKGSSPEAIRVVYAEPEAGVRLGATLVSCDGQSVRQLNALRVEPFFWNSAIPHQRYDDANELFESPAGDPQRLHECTFSSGEIALKWRREDAADLRNKVNAALAGPPRKLNIVQSNGVWLISIPTFTFPKASDVAAIRGFLTDLESSRSQLRLARKVVIDVRGNGGGDSAWGIEVANILWGRDLVSFVGDKMNYTADWRASSANLRMVEFDLERAQADGLHDSAADYAQIRDAMKVAIDAGQPLVRISDQRHPAVEAEPVNPMTGRVYFLTDGACKSACLDFADIILRLPGVAQVGLPTGADAIYIDNTYLTLPSGLAGIGYSMKVYRYRLRGNNQWYEPSVRWPGGDMTDDAVTKWIESLPK